MDLQSTPRFQKYIQWKWKYKIHLKHNISIYSHDEDDL